MPRGVNGPKFGVVERADAKRRALEMDLYGYTQAEIAQVLGVSQPLISEWLRAAAERLREQQMQNRAEMVRRETDVLLAVRREAYEALQKSKEDAGREVEEVTEYADGQECRKTRKERSGRLASAEHLRVIIETEKQLAALHGLDEAAKLAVFAGQTLDWDTLVRTGGAAVAGPDPVEARIVDTAGVPRALPPHEGGKK
jgi:ParB-like chromosome segregation protein Spo0J